MYHGGQFCRTGGGLDNFGTARILGSTVCDNSAYIQGGRVMNEVMGSLTIDQCTISGSFAEYDVAAL
jgi:hypothetical protein